MKKSFCAALSLVLALALILCAFPVASVAAKSVIVGDLNGNTVVEAADARTALRIATQLEEPSDYQMRAGDLDSNGKITASEAREILRVATKLSSFDTPTREFFEVTLPQSDLYTVNKISGSTLAKAGEGLSFSLSVAPSCSQSTPVVKLGEEELSAVSGVYTISNIQSDCAVTIEGVQLNSYAVTLPEGTGYTAAPYGGANPEFVEHGKSFRFTVSLAAAYSKSSLTVRANGIKLTPASGGVYTVNAVTQDQIITVTGVKINTYTVTLPKDTDENGNSLGFAVLSAANSASPVEHGGSYAFKIILAENCSESDITIKTNERELTADANGIYRIENITANQTVTISGVKINPTGNMILDDDASNKFIRAAAAARSGSVPANMVAIYEQRFDEQPSDSNFVLEFDTGGTKSPDTLKYVYYITADMTVKAIDAKSKLLFLTDTEGYIAVKLIKEQIMPQYRDYFDGV